MVQIKTHKVGLFYTAAITAILSAKVSVADDIDTNMARMQALDKITGKVNEIDIPVDGEAKFGSFSIVIRRCVTHSPEETPENIAFVDIADTYNKKTPQNIFKGWMFSSSPALNAVEHPIYDIWLLKCYNTDDSKLIKLSPEELAQRDILPMQKKVAISVEKSNDDLPQDVIEEKDEINNTEINLKNKETIAVVVDTSIKQTNLNETEKEVFNDSIAEIEAEENGFDETEETDIPENEALTVE